MISYLKASSHLLEMARITQNSDSGNEEIRKEVAESLLLAVRCMACLATIDDEETIKATKESIE